MKMNINSAFKLARKSFPNVRFNPNEFFETDRIFVLIDIPNPDVYDDGYIVVVDKKDYSINVYGCEVFTEDFVSKAKYWKKTNGEWNFIPASLAFDE